MTDAERPPAAPEEAPGRLRVLVVVTHLLGVGHLMRGVALARALLRAGHEAVVVSGGRPQMASRLGRKPPPIVQLPPVHCVGVDFRTLRDEAGDVASDALMDERRRLLLETFENLQPDAIVTELFPFGRRQLVDEFRALLEAARARTPRPLVLASIRDILEPEPKPGRAAIALDRLQRWYDGVLFHGDGTIVPLARTFPVTPGLAARTVETGYLTEDDPDEDAPFDDAASLPAIDRLVSGGGGEAGIELYRAAIEAARLEPERSWRVLAGRGLRDAWFDDLVARAPPNCVVERTRPDFAALLRRVPVSLSQGGYNTVLDLVRARARAVVVPFEGGVETEQGVRAARFAELGLLDVLRERDLTPAALVAAAQAREARPRPTPPPLALDGQRRSVAALERLSAGKRRTEAARGALADRLRRLADEGRTVGMWWRDDDATAPSLALDRLLNLAADHATPLAIAAIPALAEAELAERLQRAVADGLDLDVLVHGLSHGNRAAEGRKRSEWGHREDEAGLAPGEVERELREALSLARARFGALARPVFVPPWNRISQAAAAQLAASGYRGLSTFGGPGPAEARVPGALPGLVLAPTHLDPIDWRGGGVLADEEGLWLRLAALVEAQAKGELAGLIGLLTHHAAQDGWTWRFVAELLELVAASGAVRWHCARDVFGANGDL